MEENWSFMLIYLVLVLYKSTDLVLSCCQTSQAPKKNSCREVMCHSHDHTRTNCTVEDLQTITSVVLINASRVSDELCSPHNRPHGKITSNGGIYGFYENYIWVDNSCRAKFHVCGVQGLVAKCTAKTCESYRFNPNICTVKGMERVTSMAVTKLESDSSCTFDDGPPVGKYGFNNTFIWVDYGCRANFTVCGYPEAITMSKILPKTRTVLVSTEKSLTTTSVPSTVSFLIPTTSTKRSLLSAITAMDISTPPNALPDKALKQDVLNTNSLSVDTVIGISLGSVAVLAVSGGGTFLWYKLVSRNRVLPQHVEE